MCEKQAHNIKFVNRILCNAYSSNAHLLSANKIRRGGSQRKNIDENDNLSTNDEFIFWYENLNQNIILQPNAIKIKAILPHTLGI